MKQLRLAAVRFERYGKTTRRAVFLAEMDRVVPWRVQPWLKFITLQLWFPESPG
jgi:hypothetical protein